MSRIPVTVTFVENHNNPNFTNDGVYSGNLSAVSNVENVFHYYRILNLFPSFLQDGTVTLDQPVSAEDPDGLSDIRYELRGKKNLHWANLSRGSLIKLLL